MLKVSFKLSKDLLKVFSTIEKIVNKNEEKTVFKWIKFSKVGDKLHIFAMNPNMKINYIVQDTLYIEGDYSLFDCKKLLPLLNVLNGKVEINKNIVQNEQCKYTIPIITEEYPEYDLMPKLIYNKEINSNDFKNAITNVLPATSEVDGVLSGIYINENKVVSCDQNRVFINNIENTDLSIVIGKELSNEILKLPFKENIYINTFKNNIYIEDGNITLISNYINKPYPKYESVFPKNKQYEIELSNYSLERALNLLAPIIDNEIPKCNLTFTTNKLILNTDNNGSTADTQMQIKSNIKDNEKVEVKFSFKYLNNMLKANTENIKITTYSDNIGFMFESENAKQYIMPML